MNELDSNNKLKNLGIVLNDIAIDDMGYGGKYGYEDSGQQKSFLRKLKSAFS